MRRLSRAPLLTTLFALGLSACGPEVEKLPEGGLASETKSMKPASMTIGERVGKADGYDPRDTHATYAFTKAPDDIRWLPSEADPTQMVLIGYTNTAQDLQPFFVEMIRKMLPYVPTVVIYVDSNNSASSLYYALQDAGVDTDLVYFAQTDLDSIWIRDYGPLVVKTDDDGFRVVDMRYYYGRWADDALPTRLAEAWQIPVSRPALDTEGGNLQSDGAGRCILTERTIEQNAHRGYGSAEIKKVLADYLGCKTTVILPELAYEGTGHVDMFATINAAGEVIVGDYDDEDDPINAPRVDEAARMLKSAGFKVRRIPMPTNVDGAFRSYTNSLAVDDAVLVPVYSDDTRYEAQALKVFAQAYPGRKIIPVDSTEIIQWAGAVHCVTMTVGY